MLRTYDYDFARLLQAETLRDAEKGRMAARVNRHERETGSRRSALRLRLALAR